MHKWESATVDRLVRVISRMLIIAEARMVLGEVEMAEGIAGEEEMIVEGANRDSTLATRGRSRAMWIWMVGELEEGKLR
jgi:hypothetical protein